MLIFILAPTVDYEVVWQTLYEANSEWVTGYGFTGSDHAQVVRDNTVV
jgi:hypothetical protein